MRILIAPDKFKGTLNAREVAQNIAKGLLDVMPDAQIEIVPMADGGEGTAEAICDARGCSWIECKAHDPLGREIDARYGWIDQEKLAVMEMSEAAGMRRLSESERDPIRATTFGVGEMILDCDETRCERNHYWSGWQRDKRWRFRHGARVGISVLIPSMSRIASFEQPAAACALTPVVAVVPKANSTVQPTVWLLQLRSLRRLT